MATVKKKKATSKKALTVGPVVSAVAAHMEQIDAIREAFESAVEGTMGQQVFPGSYLLLDDAGNQIGAMYCVKASGTKNLEYYGLNGFVGGTGTPDGTVVFKLVWRDPFFADLASFQAYCGTKGYGLHILATCITGGW